MKTKIKNNIAILGGARPNFMKIAPLYWELTRAGANFFVINAGQHYSREMSADFLTEFGVKVTYTLTPDGADSVKQFADIIVGLETIFLKEKPSLLIVVGDVNATLAGAIVAKKMGIPLAHVEAGLRSRNHSMHEEHNRILVDHASSYLFVTTKEGRENLRREGIENNVYDVGNLMIDTLLRYAGEIKKTDEEFYFCTLHRSENVDDKETFGGILSALEKIAQDKPIYMPLHPRTEKMAKKWGYFLRMKKNLKLLAPLSYEETIFYEKNALLVLTDSGGVQEESSVLGVPCLTLRTETERPVTVTLGTNTIAGVTKRSILAAYKKKSLKRKKVSIPLWDGKAVSRIVRSLKKLGYV